MCGNYKRSVRSRTLVSTPPFWISLKPSTRSAAKDCRRSWPSTDAQPSWWWWWCPFLSAENPPCWACSKRWGSVCVVGGGGGGGGTKPVKKGGGERERERELRIWRTAGSSISRDCSGPKKHEETVWHHQNTLWKKQQSKSPHQGQERKCHPRWRGTESKMGRALQGNTQQTYTTSPTRHPTTNWAPRYQHQPPN